LQERGWMLWGWWWVLTGWIFTLGMVYMARFIQGKWQSMRVIEPELEVPIAESPLTSDL